MSEQESESFDTAVLEELEPLELEHYNLQVEDNADLKTKIVVVGVGATGSAFMLLLAHYLKYYPRNDVHIYDHDWIEDSNFSVSMYGFFSTMGIYLDRESKAYSSKRLLIKLSGVNNRSLLNNSITYHIRVVNNKVLTTLGKSYKINYIFVFTDNNKSRYEIAKYHQSNPDVIVFDCRIGSYSQFEVYFSNNPKKYMQTIYFDDKKRTKLSTIVTNNICLDDRMNFSVAMTSASILMNMFTQFLKGDLKTDFKHIMVGNDYIGEVKGYDE